MNLQSSSPTTTSSRIGLAALAALLLAAPAVAQDGPKLDVPYVPTPETVVEKMLEMAQVSSADYVVDLGSGDGRIAIAAAKRGATAMGVDLNPVRVNEAKQNAKTAGVEDKVTFKQGDLFKTDFTKADVLTLYLYESVNLKLRPEILEKLEPGTRVVSHAFSMAEWEPDQSAQVEGRNVYFWVVPAKVEGTWRIQNGGKDFSVQFNQSFQQVSGTATIDGKSIPVTDGKLRGNQISFTIGSGTDKTGTFKGQIEGDTIKPAAGSDSANAGDWEGKRAS